MFEWYTFDNAFYSWVDILLKKKVVNYDDGWIKKSIRTNENYENHEIIAKLMSRE